MNGTPAEFFSKIYFAFAGILLYCIVKLK